MAEFDARRTILLIIMPVIFVGDCTKIQFPASRFGDDVVGDESEAKVEIIR